MTVLKFPSKHPDSPFFQDITEDGYHIYSLKNAEIPDYYPNMFPDYSGVLLKNLKLGDTITVRAFFRIGTGENIRVDGGYMDLEVEHIEAGKVVAVIRTQLPEEFPLETGGSIDIFEDEILSKTEPTGH